MSTIETETSVRRTRDSNYDNNDGVNKNSFSMQSTSHVTILSAITDDLQKYGKCSSSSSLSLQKQRRRNQSLFLWWLSLSCLLAIHSMSTLSYCGAFSMEPNTVVANAKRTCSRLHKQRLGKNNCLGGSTLLLSTAPTETGGTTPGAPQVLDDLSSRIHDREHVWIWEDETGNESSSSSSSSEPCCGTWKRAEQITQSSAQQQLVPISASSTETVTSLVRNWCEDFVLALDLCPWAKASLQTRGGMRFFLVPPSLKASIAATNNGDEMTREETYILEESETQRMGRIVDDVAGRFQAEILNHTTTTTMKSSPMEIEHEHVPRDESDDAKAGDPPSQASVLERAAIYFVIFLSPKDASPSLSPLLSDSFPDFIDWFTEMEDNWPDDFDDVIIAPFHPSWEFGSPSAGDYTAENANPEACLDYEKRSPYPLVTLVSTGVVEKAGMAVTEAIGEHNKEVLMGIEAKQQQQGIRGDENENDGEESKGREGIAKKSHANASVAELWWSAVYGKRGTETNQSTTINKIK